MALGKIRIYWANALFTEADRRYNAFCVKMLRESGFAVFLPQESNVNESRTPSSEEIFRIDTAAVFDSQLLVACLDQETIDSGVACEVGLAYAFNIPVIGFYTDIRQHRQGKARMYKNLYVLGAIEAHGETVASLEELIRAIPRYVGQIADSPSSESIHTRIERHYDDVAETYSEFIRELESWYQPPWSYVSSVNKWVSLSKPNRILEFGCGTGNLGTHIRKTNPEIAYLGFDSSNEMVALAQKTTEDKSHYTSDLNRVLKEARENPFDLVIAPFTLHDHGDKDSSMRLLRDCVRVGGTILIIDLSTQDLPELTGRLRRGLARPSNIPDNRISPEWILTCSLQSNLEIVGCELALTGISFATFADLDRYLAMFGIYEGMDLPLGLRNNEASNWRARVDEVFKGYAFPFNDQRVFVICALRKKSS
jgi:nucleoside 2-deoxyribosyltransferase/ubiquinone/menaquinone biosynthesis C-methylase UbiE